MSEWKRFGVFFSFSNLVLLDLWGFLFARGYGLVAEQFKLYVLLLMSLVFVFSVGLYLLDRFFLEAEQAWRRRAGLVVFGALLFAIPFEIRQVLSSYYSETGSKSIWYFIAYFFLSILSFTYWKNKKKVRLVIQRVCLCFLPFGLLMFFKGGGAVFTQNRLAPLHLKQTERPRVIWMVFDELDFHLAFSKREEGIELPHLDRLASESFMGTAVEQAGRATLVAIPSLIIGKKVIDATPINGDTLHLKFADGTVSDWKDEESVFSRAYAKGINTAMLGWYHPYERMLSQHLTYCHTAFRPIATNARKPLEVLSRLIWHEFPYIRSGIKKWFHQKGINKAKTVGEFQGHINCYLEILEEAKKLLFDPRYQLIMIHWPIPHTPGIFDSKRRVLSTNKHTYSENLLLLDRTLGELRSEMEAAGVWDDVCLIITSDHWLRKEQVQPQNGFFTHEKLEALNRKAPLVPLIVKMPHSNEGSLCEEPFNAILIEGLIGEILDKNVNSPAEVASYFIDSVKNIY